MTVYDNSAAHRAAAIRAHARRPGWRWLLARLGVTAHTRRADAQAARWQVGAQAEDVTKAMLCPLEAQGWRILHDRRLPGSRANLDHVLVSPCGTAVVVLDTKRWHARRETVLLRGRVHCGVEDRHGQVEAVASYAARVAEVLGLPASAVWPLLVVHGSLIRGGRLEARAPRWEGVVHVLGPEFLVPTLANSPTAWNPQAAAALAEHVARVLPPYEG
ncbi:nuclease-related domain-containing protein [Streptomyces scabiei]|uniref:nuclease-related domain-containing protein n=1 Tax=Streptomyces scabiei TaxID=1930 RepID=UPI000765B59E|nr:nuclease-related domain-containing protein [Streptomyces scabiei]MDX2996402.1 nuclease-related domain-containing protein [Streptomyces scabiei]MDX3049887.1 nuclease-related domain-containing protein [Streptomyces scabiei]MDX3174164.1 nuclease-related domain-containing protein [Streptomyces scabiei]